MAVGAATTTTSMIHMVNIVGIQSTITMDGIKMGKEVIVGTIQTLLTSPRMMAPQYGTTRRLTTLNGVTIGDQIGICIVIQTIVIMALLDTILIIWTLTATNLMVTINLATTVLDTQYQKA